MRRRATLARASLAECHLCERRCGVNRLAGERAPCGLGDETWTFKRHVSFAEEIELLPSYMVYFGGCNFRCAFCVQAPACFDPRRGELVDPAALAAECAGVVRRGARTVNLLGGEPSLHLHTILELAAAGRHEVAEGGGAGESDEGLPLVLNSNFYMTPEVLDLLDGVVGLYLADFKFGCDACARRVAGVDRYVEVVTRNLLAAARQGERNGSRLLVRHLVMPGHVECCLDPVAGWMREHLPSASLHVMDSYVPAFRAAGRAGSDAGGCPELGSMLSESERARAAVVLGDLGYDASALAPSAEVTA